MFLYFIQAFGQKELIRIKIGRSRDPDGRLQHLQIGSPVKLKMLGTIKCRDDSHAQSMEKLAHNIFHKQRKRGEWFRLSAKHLVQIKSLIETANQRNASPEFVSERRLIKRVSQVIPEQG